MPIIFARVLRRVGRALLVTVIAVSPVAMPATADGQPVREQRLIQLLNASPLFSQDRGLEAEARYVAQVRALFGPSDASNVRSVDDAMATLEKALEPRRVSMRVITKPAGQRVEYKRFRFRDDSTVLWTPLLSDTVVTVPAAAYRIRFRPSTSTRDSILDIPCADGCRVPPERQ
jgi:hypothetical protein